MPIRAIALIVVLFMLVNDIAWAEPAPLFKPKENPFTLAAESRLNPFFKEHGLDFRNIAQVMYVAGKLRDIIASGDVRESHIVRLNRLFADGTVEIDMDIHAANLKATGRQYHIATFRFAKEKKAVSAYFVSDPEKLNDDELNELGLADGRDRAFFMSPDYPGLKGVWFAGAAADNGVDPAGKPRVPIPWTGPLVELFRRINIYDEANPTVWANPHAAGLVDHLDIKDGTRVLGIGAGKYPYPEVFTVLKGARLDICEPPEYEDETMASIGILLDNIRGESPDGGNLAEMIGSRIRIIPDYVQDAKEVVDGSYDTVFLLNVLDEVKATYGRDEAKEVAGKALSSLVDGGSIVYGALANYEKTLSILQEAADELGLKLIKLAGPIVTDGHNVTADIYKVVSAKAAILEMMRTEAGFDGVTDMLLEHIKAGDVKLVETLSAAVKEDDNFEPYLERLQSSIYAIESFIEVSADDPTYDGPRDLLDSTEYNILNTLDTILSDSSADELPGLVTELQALLSQKVEQEDAPTTVSGPSPSGGWRQEEFDLQVNPESQEAAESSGREVKGYISPQPKARMLSDVEPNISFGEMVRDRGKLAALVEEPLLAACQLLFDKGITTLSSSANKMSIGGHAYIRIFIPLLSKENLAIAKEICSDNADTTCDLRISIPEDCTVEELSRQAVALADRFVQQELGVGCFAHSFGVEGEKAFAEFMAMGKDRERQRFKPESPGAVDYDRDGSRTDSPYAVRSTQYENEANSIHIENLKFVPDNPEKTLVCHIVTESIVPESQHRMLNSVAEELRKEKYPEKIAVLSADESISADDFMRKLEEVKGQKWIKEYLDKGYTITFDVACHRQDLVQKVQDAGMQALAFSIEGDGGIVQVEGIIMALRALGTRKMDELLKAFRILAGRDASVSAKDVMELARRLTFILPLRRIDTNRIGALNGIIVKNILAAA